MSAARRGEVWRVELEPVRGREQGGTRPALVISNDIFNRSAAEMVVVVPMTTKGRPIRSFLQIDPPEGGLRQRSYVICDQVRTIASSRLTRRLGQLSAGSIREVEQRLKFLLDLR